MIGVIIPAHNEAESIGACVRSVAKAASHPELAGEKVFIVVVADHCSDLTEHFAVIAGAVVISVFKRNVGTARSIGANLAIAHGARWLAFTDADSTVPPDWLVEQVRCGTDVVCGVVSVLDWSEHSTGVRDQFYRDYRDMDDHRHIHGANLSCSVAAYEKAGGFQPLRFDEDVALVGALVAIGASFTWTNRVRVNTSARDDFRVPWGFGATLRAAAQRIARKVLTDQPTIATT